MTKKQTKPQRAPLPSVTDHEHDRPHGYPERPGTLRNTLGGIRLG